jgi:hypothetical protein
LIWELTTNTFSSCAAKLAQVGRQAKAVKQDRVSLDWPESAAYLGKYENRNRYLRESAAFNPCRLRCVGYLQVHEKRRRCESTGVRFHSAACADSLSSAHSGRLYGVAVRHVVRREKNGECLERMTVRASVEMAWVDAAPISKKSRISQKPHILHFTNADASVTISILIFEVWVFSLSSRCCWP